MIAEVIVDIATNETDRVFDYLADETVAEGSRVMVRFGGRYTAGFVVGIKEGSDVPPEKLRPIERVLDEKPALTAECLSLVRAITKRYKVPTALALRLFLPSEMRTGKVREAYVQYASLKEGIDGTCLSKSAVKQREVIGCLQKFDSVELSKLKEEFGASAVQSLVKKGFLELTKMRRNRSPYRSVAGDKEEAKVLTDEQQMAMQSIDSSPQTVQLIFGVTGSGKTEIYLRYIAKQLEKGKSAIFLVPEISLTPQMLNLLRSRFGEAVAILHSGLSAGERFDEWQRLRFGEAKIAVGARSAVFAPLENLGAIVIDEEHDGSYTSETSPRYNTFDIARIRAKHNGCKLILGSATPSVETFMRAKSGEYNLIRLQKRVNQRPMPEIIFADMRKEVRRGNQTAFSQQLRDELSDCLENGRQAIVFLNRRGYSQTVVCQECGYVAKCENCDVTLTYHSEEDCLKCHFCGARYKMLKNCPDCGGVRLRYRGTGTQRVVQDLKELFPKARILRMDNDTTSGKEGHYSILKRFSEREADILVGTQMIAKGHDFPAVTLVGILDADMSLHFADYRSGERTFQLITQVAGRSGRAGQKGKVVLQTYSPMNDILRFAGAYDYEGFYENELALRKAVGFPPFAKIVRVMVTSADDEKALAVLKTVYFALEDLYRQNKERFLFFNKMRSPVKRIQNRFRYQVLMRMTDGKLLSDIYRIVDSVNDRNVLVYVEENPANLS